MVTACHSNTASSIKHKMYFMYLDSAMWKIIGYEYTKCL